MASIGQDDLALEHLQAVETDIPETTFNTVVKEEFEANVAVIMKDLKERIALRDSIGQKL